MANFGDNKAEINDLAKKCLEKSTEAYTNIMTCANTIKGDELLHSSGIKTLALDNPPMNYIPWLVLNGSLPVFQS